MYIVESLKEQDLAKHKMAFCLGNILPDCKPSFITVRHEMEGTFPKLQSDLKHLIERMNGSEINMRVFYRQLGEIIHYIADYFTFPHNAHYPGNLKDHCVYEETLKKGLREYIRSGEAIQNREMIRANAQYLNSSEAICEFIQRAHDIYVNITNSVEEDCRQIVALCHQVVEAVIVLIQKNVSGQLALSM